MTIFKNLLIFFYLLLTFNNSYAQVPITTDSRIRTLVYNPNEVYELKFYYNYQSFIEFSDDEEIEMISIGEAFAWRLTPAEKRLFIRPLEIAAHTNMTIITNKRTYHFDIRSDEFDGKADENLVYTVRFFYPQSGQPIPLPPQLAVPNIAAKQMPVAKQAFDPRMTNNLAAAPKSEIITPVPDIKIGKKLPDLITRNPDQAQLNFNYSVAGRADNIVPLKVYDNENETYFQFENDNKLIPTINKVSASGAEQPLNYIIRDKYVVVPTVSKQFTLRLSDNLLCIFNNKLLNRN